MAYPSLGHREEPAVALVRRVRESESFLGFAHGFDGNASFRADYETEDGFTSVGCLCLPQP
ncbi:hypothetical protein ACIBUR_16135 [Streptomyces anulatus]